MKMRIKSLAALILTICILSACGSSGSGQTSDAPNETISEMESKEEKESEAASQGQTTVVKDNRRKKEDAATEDQEKPKTETPVIAPEDLEIRECSYENSIGTTIWYLIVTNKGSGSGTVRFNGTAYNAGGDVIGAANAGIDILGPSETSLAYFYFDSVTGIDHVEYSVMTDAASHYYPVLADLSMEQNINDRNLTVKVTNNGSRTAQFVQAYALFFDADNNLISADSEYVVDNDSEIKPGGSCSGQMNAYKDFDHAECYLTGRSDGSAGSAVSSISGEDFDVREYLYENSFASMYYLVIKNNSEYTVSISGNAEAMDAEGNTIGAADTSVDVLGPQEESITYFYFSNVKGIASVDYSLSYSESRYYSPVISDLAQEITINNSNVIVTLTNNGSEAARFVQAYALFMDSSGNIVYTDSGYITDDDSELKSGATLSKQLDCRTAFDHVEVYLTGRR
jgi:tripartite-type tricarboxylate transporter receptor subunit TctC